MNKHHIERVKSPDDPERCQGIVPAHGQCLMRAVPGGKRCIFHGGSSELDIIEKKNIFTYRLERYKNRVEDFQSSPALKSLRDEVALTRFLTQKILEYGSNDLLQFCVPVTRLMNQVRELSLASARIEHSLETIIEYDNAVEIAHNVLLQVQNHEKFEELGEEILLLLEKMSKKTVIDSAAEGSYKIPKWQNEIKTFISKEKIVSIRSEIAVLRILVEDIQDFFFNLNTISTLINQIREFVLSCHKLETSMGLMLSKAEAGIFGTELVRILGSHLDEETLKKIKI
jgi:hypothetical protein